MQPGHERWTDSRIDDAFERVNERISDTINEIRVNRDLPKAVAEMAIQMKYVAEGVRACSEAQGRLDERLANYMTDQDTARRETFHWAVGAVFAATALVLTAAGLLIGKF